MDFQTMKTIQKGFSFFTFVLHGLNGKQPSSMGVDEHFAQDAERVNKEGILQLSPSVNGPLGRTWNDKREVILEDIEKLQGNKMQIGEKKYVKYIKIKGEFRVSCVKTAYCEYFNRLISLFVHKFIGSKFLKGQKVTNRLTFCDNNKTQPSCATVQCDW